MTMTEILAESLVAALPMIAVGWLIARSSLLQPPRDRIGDSLHENVIEQHDEFQNVTGYQFRTPKSTQAKWIWKLLTCTVCVGMQIATWLLVVKIATFTPGLGDLFRVYGTTIGFVVIGGLYVGR